MKDISKLHGKRFTATISGVKTSGKISYDPEEGELFLCQNSKDGSYTRNKLGYKYSWAIGSSIDPKLLEARYSVLDFRVITKSTWEDLTTGDKLKSCTWGTEWEVAAKIGKIYILIGEDETASGNYTLKELIESFSLVQEEEEKEEVVEVTLEDVAKNMGIPVEKLRIKD